MPQVAYITRLAQQKDAHLVVRWQSESWETLAVDDALHQQGSTVHLLVLDSGNAKVSRRGSFVVRNSTEVGYQHLETRKPGVHALCTPDPRGKARGLPAAAPLATATATATPVTAAVAIGTLLLRPGFIHNQGPPGKLRAMQSLDGLLRLSRRTHIDKTKSPRLPSIFVGNDAGGFNR